MLQIEYEHETRVDWNYYQNNVNNSNPEEPNNNQYTKNHTPHFVENNSNLNTIYQNTRTRIQLPNEKHWTIPLLLESLKSKNFQSPDLEIDFFIDSGAETKKIIIPTWNKIKIKINT